jgi:hypothetical protein
MFEDDPEPQPVIDLLPAELRERIERGCDDNPAFKKLVDEGHARFDVTE